MPVRPLTSLSETMIGRQIVVILRPDLQEENSYQSYQAHSNLIDDNTIDTILIHIEKIYEPHGNSIHVGQTRARPKIA